MRIKLEVFLSIVLARKDARYVFCFPANTKLSCGETPSDAALEIFV